MGEHEVEKHPKKLSHSTVRMPPDSWKKYEIKPAKVGRDALKAVAKKEHEKKEATLKKKQNKQKKAAKKMTKKDETRTIARRLLSARAKEDPLKGVFKDISDKFQSGLKDISDTITYNI